MNVLLGEPDELIGGTILNTVPFRFRGIHTCEAMLVMSLCFNFNRDAIDCLESIFKVRSFDLHGINSFHKRLKQRSKTVMSALDVAVRLHEIKKVFDIQNVDFRNNGTSSRFHSKDDEYQFQRDTLLESREMILELYPHLEVVLLYADLIDDRSKIEISEIFPDGTSRVRMVPDFLYRDICKCLTAVLSCMDFRIRREIRSFSRYGLKEDMFDLLPYAGTMKLFLEGSNSAWKALRHLYEKHGCRKLIIFPHSDCGAYASKGFRDFVDEEVFQRSQVEEFKKMLFREFPDMETVSCYVRITEDRENIKFILF